MQATRQHSRPVPCRESCAACLQVVDYLVRQGFYVNVDFHSIGFHKTLITGETPFSGADDYSLYDIPGWTQLW